MFFKPLSPVKPVCILAPWLAVAVGGDRALPEISLRSHPAEFSKAGLSKNCAHNTIIGSRCPEQRQGSGLISPRQPLSFEICNLASDRESTRSPDRAL